MNWLVIDKIIKAALTEDNPLGDITTESIVFGESYCMADLISKDEGVVAGLNVFRRVYEILGNVNIEFLIEDGQRVNKYQKIGWIKGNIRNVLIGERVALNFLQRLSGIATITNKMVNELKGTNIKLLDTRKTTPNMRILEKYAVKLGGGYNHRFNLSDGILIKDNHINAAGGIKEAVKRVRDNMKFIKNIEVEVESLEQVKEAIKARVDIIMLDNMENEILKESIKLINKKAKIEVSGNMSLDKIKEISKMGVDYISCGIITHSVKAFDLSLKNLQVIK